MIQPIKLNSRPALINLKTNQVAEIPENCTLILDSKSKDIIGVQLEERIALNWRPIQPNEKAKSDWSKYKIIEEYQK